MAAAIGRNGRGGSGRRSKRRCLRRSLGTTAASVTARECFEDLLSGNGFSSIRFRDGFEDLRFFFEGKREAFRPVVHQYGYGGAFSEVYSLDD